MVEGIKSPESVQSPEMIRQSCRIPELFQVIETSSSFFCPEETGQGKQKTGRIFEAFPGIIPKMQHAKALVRETSAMSKCQGSWNDAKLSQYSFFASGNSDPTSQCYTHRQGFKMVPSRKQCPQKCGVAYWLQETIYMWGSEAASQMEDNLILNLR